MSHHHRHGSHLVYFELAKRIFKNKIFLFMALALLLMVLAVGIWLIAMLIPFLGQLLTVIENNGLKGIIEAISTYLLKLWEGAGK
jgi:hypothetical protein